MSVSYSKFREMMLRLPGVEEGTAYGTPIFKIKSRMLARQTEDADIIVIKIDPALRSTLIEATDAFFVTPHYIAHPLMLIDLKKVGREDLAYLAEQAWRMIAPKKLIAEFDR